MKANLFLALLLLGCCNWLPAQFVQSYLAQAGLLHQCRTDAAGNVYMAIDVTGDTLGGIAYPTPTSSGLGFAKFDPNGLLQWVNMATYHRYSSVLDMDVDAGGNIVFTAMVYDSIRWGGILYEALPVVGANDQVVIGLMDSTGTLLWLHGLHATMYGGYGVNFLPDGDIAWGMGYTGTASLNGYNFPTAGSYEGYLLVLDRNGIVQTAHHLDAVADATILDAVGGPNQDIWLVGAFSGTSATFLGATIQGNNSGHTTFFARISANGNLQWTTAFQQGHANVGALAVDDAGNCYFAGSIYTPVTLGGIPLGCAPGGSEMLAGRLYPNGTCGWMVASQSLANNSYLASIDYHPVSGLLCWGVAQYGTGTFAGMPFSAGQYRSYFAVLDTHGVGTTSILLDTTTSTVGYHTGQWADTGLVFYAGFYGLSGGNLLGTVLPPPPHQYGSFASYISTSGNRLEGKVYADLDQNGVFGAGDVPVPFHPVTTTNGLAGVTDVQGKFGFVVGPGSQTLTTAAFSPFYQVLPPTATVSFAALNDVDSGTVFRLVPTSIVPDLRLDLLAPPSAQPGLMHQLHLLASNIGSQAASGTMTLDLDPAATLVLANPAPDTILGTHLAWNVGPLSPLGQLTVTVTVELDSLLAMNDTVTYAAALYGPALDFDLENQAASAHVVVVTSFDPNDKAVSPAAAPSAYLLDGGKLRYVVRFQNTGNAPAHRVIIRDTLSSQLALAGFRFVGSSHPVSVRLYSDHILHLVFDPISLPDSASDPLLSQGYAVFELPTVTGLVSGDSISNRVGIYFDYNAPVLTNSAVFHVLEPVIGVEGSTSALSATLYPNPGTDAVHIQGLSPRMFPVEVSLVDMNGRVLKQQSYRVVEGELRMPLEACAPGAYLVKVRTADGRVAAFRWLGR